MSTIKPFSDAIKAELIKSYSYDPETGVITNRQTGKALGGKGSGYLKMKVLGRVLYRHRVAYFLGTGEEPKQVIDHANGNRADNRLCNLRDVSQSFNTGTRHRASRKNKSGLLGASRNKNAFSAVIVVSGERIYLGNFGTAEEAHERYLLERRKRGLV